MANTQLVLYKHIKAKVTMAMVLERYGLLEGLRRSGSNLVGCCPIHKGTNPNQFSVSPERNLFNCFGDCKAGGNVIDFVAKMENLGFREAALCLQNWFMARFPDRTNGKPLVTPPKRAREANRGVAPQTKENQPLAFTLKSLKKEHPFFEERGLTRETVETFGLGFCEKGLMKDRIAIPIHNQRGELVAYCGRAVKSEQIEVEKYKQPPNFKKSLVVYNLHRQDPQEKILILVESFISVWRLHQAGHKNTVALMGSSLSEDQEALLVSALGPSGRATLLFDGDEGGQKCAHDCLARLSRNIFVKALDIRPYAKKPHHLSPEQIVQIIQ